MHFVIHWKFWLFKAIRRMGFLRLYYLEIRIHGPELKQLSQNSNNFMDFLILGRGGVCCFGEGFAGFFLG